jgi:hypothetical protein
MPIFMQRLLDSFLKISPAEFGGGLDDAVQSIDGDISKLLTLNGDGFLTFEAAHKMDFAAIGDAFLTISGNFQKVDIGSQIADGVVIAIIDNGFEPNFPSSPFQTDFQALKFGATATDFKILGTDFAALGTSPDPRTFMLKLQGIGGDFLKLEGDMAADGGALVKLGDDVKAAVDFFLPSPFGNALKRLGGELDTIGMDFHKLSGDFLKLQQSLGGGDDGSDSGNTVGAGLGAALTVTLADFKLLAHDENKLAHGASTVINDLIRLADGSVRLPDEDDKFSGNNTHDGKLNGAFLKIDFDVSKLSSLNGDGFTDFEHKHKGDFTAIGNALTTEADSVLKGEITGAVDNVIIAVLNGGGTTPLQDDFERLDQSLNTVTADFKLLGADFAALPSSPDAETFKIKLEGAGNDVLKLQGNTAASGKALMQVAADFLALGDVANPSPLDLAYKELGGELQTVAGDFGKLSNDFGKLSQALAGGGAGTPAAGGGDASNTIGGTLAQIVQDFHALSTDGGAATQATNNVIEDLVHQVLHAGAGPDHGDD